MDQPTVKFENVEAAAKALADLPPKLVLISEAKGCSPGLVDPSPYDRYWMRSQAIGAMAHLIAPVNDEPVIWVRMEFKAEPSPVGVEFCHVTAQTYKPFTQGSETK